jgi:hypothetical protein
MVTSVNDDDDNDPRDPDARPEKQRTEGKEEPSSRPTMEPSTDSLAAHRKARWRTRTLHRKRSSYNLRDEFRSGELLAANKAATYSPGTHLRWEQDSPKKENPTPSYPKTNPPVLKRKRNS